MYMGLGGPSRLSKVSPLKAAFPKMWHDNFIGCIEVFFAMIDNYGSAIQERFGMPKRNSAWILRLGG